MDNDSSVNLVTCWCGRGLKSTGRESGNSVEMSWGPQGHHGECLSVEGNAAARQRCRVAVEGNAAARQRCRVATAVPW